MANEITVLLGAHAAGDERAFDRLFSRIYEDLREMARRRLVKGRPGSIDTTGLVHEAYLRLVGQPESAWSDRGHFFAVASLSMRSVVVDHARRLQSAKRGGDQVRVTASADLAELGQQVDEVLAVHEALHRLEEIDSRLVRIVEHRYFSGLTEKEAAEALGVSHRTAQRLWRKARSWLRKELGR